jgi:hypothetical protein
MYLIPRISTCRIIYCKVAEDRTKTDDINTEVLAVPHPSTYSRSQWFWKNQEMNLVSFDWR